MTTISQTSRPLFLLMPWLFCVGCESQTAPSQRVPPVTSAPNQLDTAKPAPQPQVEQVLKLSAGAAERLRTMRDKGKLKPDAVVRIAVLEGNFFRLKNGGDKRYRYTLAVDDDPKDVDQYVSMESQGLTIQVPKTSADFLRGTEVIWIESGGKGAFKFLNPNQMTDDEVTQVIPEAETPNSKSDAEKPSGPTPTPLTDDPATNKSEGRPD